MMKDATTAAATDSPRTVASKVSFDPPPEKPPKLQHVSSKPLRMNFLRRKAKSQDEDSLSPKAKSQDEDEINDEDEAEIKRLQRKVEYLEKKKKLVQKIKKIERGIEAVDVESDDEATWEKEKVSPKRWPSFRLKRRKNRDRSDSFEDDLTFDDDDNSPLLEKFHSALDYIEDSCSPIIHEIKDLTVVCTELLSPSKENGESARSERMNMTKRSSKEFIAAPVPEQDAKSKTDEVAEDSQVSSLAPMLIALSKQISQSFSRTEDAADDLQEQEKIPSCDAQVHGKFGATNVEAGLETASTQGQERDNSESSQILGSNEQAFGLMDKASKASSESSPSLVFNQDNVGLDCFNMQPAKPDSEPAISPGNETDAKFVEVTVTAMALSGLAISSKTNHKGGIPPVHAVLSVLNDTTSGECPAFTHVPSLRVVNDPSRGPIKKNKFDRSAKYHVMGVWDLSKKDDASISGEVKSSVTFSRLVGMSTSDMIDKKREVTISPSTLHLRVCVKRDDRDDILPVGVAKVLISGQEPRDVELAVPVRPEYYKSISDLTKKLNTKPPQSKWESFKSFALDDEDDVLSCVRFRGFKNETYRLEKDSFLRIRLKIAPYVQGMQSQLLGSIPLSMPKNAITRGHSEVLTVTRELTECQDVESISLPEGPRAYFVHNSVSVENSEGNCGFPPGATQSFGKVDSRVEGVVDTPTIDTTDPCIMVNSTKNNDNTSNGVAPPYKLVDESVTEKMVSQKSRKLWFKKTKSTETRKAEVSTGSQPMLDKKLDSENIPKNAIARVDTAFQSSRELENHDAHPVKHSSSNVVEAEQTLVHRGCPGNTMNNVALDDADKTALPQLEEKHTYPSQAEDITGLNDPKDAHLQATSNTNVDSDSSDLSTLKQPGKDVVLKSNKSWFKKTLKSSQTYHPIALVPGSSKEAVLSDPSIVLYSCSSADRQALVNHKKAADNCNFRQDSLDSNVENFTENNIIERRSLTTVSLKTKEERGFQVISSEVIENSLQDMNEPILSTITASDVGNLRLPAATAAAEISVSKNENSADLQSHCVTVNSVDEVHPQNTEVEEPESQCFCQVDEFMATDIVRGTNCVERNFSHIVSDDEFEVTPDDFSKAAELAKALGLKESESVARSSSKYLLTHQLLVNEGSVGTRINESNGTNKAAEDDPCDLSECHCEDCAKNSVASSYEEDDECEGIELELKKEKTRNVQGVSEELPSMQKEARSMSNLRSMASLAGKLSRSKSRKCEI